MYKCTLLENTGFNAANIPYDLSVIWSAGTRHNVDDLDIRQQRFLTSISVSATWDMVNACDYVVLYTGTDTNGIPNAGVWCYFVTNVVMVANDVAQLSILPDFITSAGGVASALQGNIVDGIVNRSTYALYTVTPRNLATDPYLAPSKPMEIVLDWVVPYSTSTPVATLISSTLDLEAMGDDDIANTAIIFTDSDSGESVVVPDAIAAGEATGREDYYVTCKMNGGSYTLPMSNFMVFYANYSGVNTMKVKKGIAQARSLGVESAIIAQWSIPQSLFSRTLHSDTSVAINTLEGQTGSMSSANVKRTLITDESIPSAIRAVLNFSEFMPITITSASGESVSADPKDLYNDDTNYSIQWKSDPRHDGKLYFRFKYLQKDTEDSGGKWFRNIISSLPWKQVPLVFSEVSGSILNTARFSASRNIASASLSATQSRLNTAYGNAQAYRDTSIENAQNQARANTIKGAITAGGGLATAGVSLATGNPVGVAQGLTTAAMGGADIYATEVNKQAIENIANTTFQNSERSLVTDSMNAELMYSAQKSSDMLEYGIMQNIVVPEVMFPYNTETLRDFFGNGVLISRPVYKQADAIRIARIIKAFGVQYTQEASFNHFNPDNRDFCYVDANITLTNHAQWLSNAIKTQLAGGIRIWKVKPYHISL